MEDQDIEKRCRKVLYRDGMLHWPKRDASRMTSMLHVKGDI
jgi:hypothetical protein